MNRLDRRDLIKTLAVGAGTVALADARPGRAQSAALPKRVVFIYTPNGVPEHGPGYDELAKMNGSPSDFTLGEMTAEPLGPYKSKMVVAESIRMFEQRGDTHIGGYAQGLTGKPLDSQMRATNLSIDQYLADKVGRAATPKWPLLNIAMQASGASRLADGTVARANMNPYDVYSKLFDGLMTGTPTSEGPDPRVLDRLARRKSVLDAVSKNVTAFQRRLPREDRMRSEAQLSALRTLEDRLSADMTIDNKASTAKCAKPTQAVQGLREGDATKAPELTRLQFDIMFAALACDLTRVINFSWRQHLDQTYKCGFAPINQPSQDFHGLSHNNPGDSFRSFKVGKKWLFGFVGELAGKLQAIPEGESNMLDNTLLVCWTEIQRGHDNRNLQWFTIGGKNMGVSQGRYLRLGNRTPSDNEQWAHTRFLVGVLNAMGVPDKNFGDIPAWGSGPLPGFLAT